MKLQGIFQQLQKRGNKKGARVIFTAKKSLWLLFLIIITEHIEQWWAIVDSNHWPLQCECNVLTN
jgi:hypothetical protein